MQKHVRYIHSIMYSQYSVQQGIYFEIVTNVTFWHDIFILLNESVINPNPQDKLHAVAWATGAYKCCFSQYILYTLSSVNMNCRLSTDSLALQVCPRGREWPYPALDVSAQHCYADILIIDKFCSFHLAQLEGVRTARSEPDTDDRKVWCNE